MPEEAVKEREGDNFRQPSKNVSCYFNSNTENCAVASDALFALVLLEPPGPVSESEDLFKWT